MEIQISWTANWAGNHDVCYRKVGEVAFTCVTVNSILGTNSTIIDVPTNYCEDVTYEGYILAECSSDIDVDEDGFPELATQFSILINTNTDPCEPYQITCDNGAIGLIVEVPGQDYAVNDQIFANGVDLVGEVATIDGVGGILTTNLFGIYKYVAQPAISVTSALGNGASLAGPLSDCDAILTGCAGTNDDGAGLDPEGDLNINIKVGDSIVVCSEGVPDPKTTLGDTTVIPAPALDTCNCLDCVRLKIDNPTGQDLEVSYTTCNDPNGNGIIVLWKENIEAGASNYIVSDCVIQESVYAETGLVLTFEACPVPA